MLLTFVFVLFILKIMFLWKLVKFLSPTNSPLDEQDVDQSWEMIVNLTMISDEDEGR